MVLRVGLTAVAARLLTISICRSPADCSILWIALKVLIDASTPPDEAPAPKRFWQAIWYIVVADLTMSTDNVLAIAGASKGNFWLIVFGLARKHSLRRALQQSAVAADGSLPCR